MWVYGKQAHVHLAIGIEFEFRTYFASVLLTISGCLATEGLLPLLIKANLFTASSSKLNVAGAPPTRMRYIWFNMWLELEM